MRSAKIVSDVEHAPEYDENREQHVPDADESRADALARSARFLASDIGADAIVAASESGYTALKAAKFRPSIPMVSDTTVADEATEGEVVTLDAERGVIYDDTIHQRSQDKR